MSSLTWFVIYNMICDYLKLYICKIIYVRVSVVESRQLMGVGIWGKYDKVKQKRDLCMGRCWYAMSEGGWVSPLRSGEAGGEGSWGRMKWIAA